MQGIESIKERVKKHKTSLLIITLLFFTSFVYMFFFTESVPFFFDDHQFNNMFIHRTYEKLLIENFYFNQGIGTTRSTYGLFIKILYETIGLDYFWLRAAKALVFSCMIIIIYYLALHLFKRREAALCLTLFIMALFPVFLQTFGYNGPHIFGELFKYLAIIFFLKDLIKEKTSYKNQIVVLLFSLLAVRSYFPSFSIAGILPLLTLVYARKKLSRYLILFFMLLMLQIPLVIPKVSFSLDMVPHSSIYYLKFTNLANVFSMTGIIDTILNPIPTYSVLYYKLFWNILTFFGFWLIVGVFLLFLLQKIFWKTRINEIRTNNEINNETNNEVNNEIKNEINNQQRDDKLIYCLAVVWMLCELPSYLFLPESAIRYLFPFFIPFSIAVTLLISQSVENLQGKWRTVALSFVLIMLIGAALTNISYVYAFRAGWGSSFIVFEKGMNYFADNYQGKTGVLYYAGSAAEEYFYLNKSSKTYEFAEGITYIKSADPSNFSEAKLGEFAKQYDFFYVIKRITSVSHAEYPSVALETNSNLTLVATFEGIDEQIMFDRLNLWLMKRINVDYQPNKIYIYKFLTTTIIAGDINRSALL